MSDFSKTAEVDSAYTKCPAEENNNLVLIPRKYNNIFGVGDLVKDEILKGWPGKYTNSPLKKLEYNFYPDLNLERTITAILTRDAWDPHQDPRPPVKDGPIDFELIAGKDDFFLSPSQGFTSKGYFEITLRARELYQEDKIEDPANSISYNNFTNHQKVTIRATSSEHTAELSLKVHRNEDVDDNFTNVLTRETILVRQNYRFLRSAGVKRLQQLLNQVVARHKAANEFKWLDLNGWYGGDVATDVKAFVDQFKGTFDYHNGSFNARVDKALKQYVGLEYAPYNDGDLVDRDLLIGEKQSFEGAPPKDADGLLDIYNVVVRLFFSQMEGMAIKYTTDFHTEWLHDPSDGSYEEGDAIDDQFVLKKDAEKANIRNLPNGPTIRDTVKLGVTLEYQGEHETIEGKPWYMVKTQQETVGWCSSTLLMKLTNDMTKHDKNRGNHGGSGVAYSLGGKDLPEAFKNRVTNNEPKPNDIKSWYQYNWQHKDKDVQYLDRPGKDYREGPPEMNVAPGNGCDCSGFVQNCITNSKFADLTLIVPRVNLIEPKPDKLPGWPWTNCIKAIDFVDKTARKIPYHTHKKEKQWLDKTDVICSDNHVVWIANENPTTTHPMINPNFDVYNEYGKTFFYNGVDSTNAFIRKALRMPFKAWGVRLTNVESGRIYFWPSTPSVP
jgi:hypothetical protein